ncbi:MAG: (4Fe-4S)-binding protein, partial [Hyphomicrobiaceae bacterium]
CPERIIKLEPRYNFTSSVLNPILVKEEEPFECISCGKPFGTKSTIERIISRLEGRHSMFQNTDQTNIIKMCDDCRVIAVAEAGGDPMTLGKRPRVRTTDDYLIGSVPDDDESN